MARGIAGEWYNSGVIRFPGCYASSGLFGSTEMFYFLENEKGEVPEVGVIIEYQ